MLIHPGRVGRVGPGVTAVTAPVLDGLVASAAAAYSVRKLRAAYAGSAVRVRRSSDNAEADIGFSGNDLDTAALLSHVGAGDGFVVTWYDQSGNARHVTQATQSRQPRIALAGAVETGPNSRPVVRTLGAQALAVASWATVNQPFTRNYVISNATGAHLINSDNGTPNTGEYFPSANTLAMYAGTAGQPSASLGSAESAVFTSLYNGASSQLSKNGTLGSASNPGTSGFAGVTIGGRTVAADYATALFCEFVAFASLLGTTDRQALERDQGTYYGITVA